MAGKRLTVQYRSVGGKWHSTTIHALIRQDGRYAVKFHFQTTGTKALRFAYTGSTRGPWLSATAPGRLFFAT
jgi:hypothetical protein